MESLGVSRIETLPDELKELWSGVPPEAPAIQEILGPIRDWLKDAATPEDYVLIQGDFGACYLMVRFAFSEGLIPIYSTTDRVASEEHGGDGAVRVVHTFRHRIYRKYGE